MASLNKQQKRAKRAKIKAKQINIHGRKPAALDDDLGEIGEPIPEYTLAMFSKMRDAEAVSRNEMLLTLLRELVVLDELNIALKHGYLDLEQVLADLQARPPMQHVLVTGRGAKPELIDLADTVTEMGVVKHAFQAGIKAQKGIEL